MGRAGWGLGAGGETLGGALASAGHADHLGDHCHEQ